eukprot:449518_1
MESHQRTSETHGFIIEPKHELVFNLSEENRTPCTAQIRINHTIDDEQKDGSHPAYMFKVKISERDWFVVQPSQGTLDAGGSQIIVVSLTANAKQSLQLDLKQYGVIKQSRIKFKVEMAAPMDTKLYVGDASNPSSQQTELPTTVYNNVLIHTIGVQFELVKSGGKKLRDHIERVKDAVASLVPPPTPNSNRLNVKLDDSPPKHDNWDEMKKWRRKYDELMNFTVTLKAERDVTHQKLETLETTLLKEAKQREKLQIKEGSIPIPKERILKGEEGPHKRSIYCYVFQLPVFLIVCQFLLVALASFLIGLYLGKGNVDD